MYPLGCLYRIVKSFHESMEAEVRVGASLSESFEVRNGLRQGCTLAPTHFDIYFNAVVASWRGGCVEAGVDVLFRRGRKLVSDRTAKSRLCVVRVTESEFADDVALYTSSRDCLESVAKKFVERASKWGLSVSIEKTKGMAVRERLSDEDVVWSFKGFNLQQPYPLNTNQESSVQGNSAGSFDVWGRGMDFEGQACEAAVHLSQSLCEDHPRCHQV